MIAPHEIEALNSLAPGPQVLGSMDGWSKVAAALTFLELERRGLVEHAHGPDGLIWMLAPAGEAALRRLADR